MFMGFWSSSNIDAVWIELYFIFFRYVQAAINELNAVETDDNGEDTLS